MAILVKHSGNQASALSGAFLGGEGERQAQDAARLSQIASAEDLAAKQRELQRENRDLSRQWSLEDAARTRDWQLQDQAHAEALEQSRFDRGQAAQRNLIEWKVGAEQKAEFDRLQKGYEDAVASGDFTEDELKDIRNQVISRQSGLALPRPSLRVDETSMADRFRKETFERDGVLYGVDKNGKWYTLGPTSRSGQSGSRLEQGGASPPGSTIAPDIGTLGIPRAEYTRLWSQVRKELATTDADGNVHAPTSEEIHAAIRAMLDQGGYGVPMPHPRFAREFDIDPDEPPATPRPLEDGAAAWSAALAQEQGAPEPPAEPPATPSPTSLAPTSPPSDPQTLRPSDPSPRLPPGVRATYIRDKANGGARIPALEINGTRYPFVTQEELDGQTDRQTVRPSDPQTVTYTVPGYGTGLTQEQVALILRANPTAKVLRN